MLIGSLCQIRMVLFEWIDPNYSVATNLSFPSYMAIPIKTVTGCHRARRLCMDLLIYIITHQGCVVISVIGCALLPKQRLTVNIQYGTTNLGDPCVPR